MRCVVLVALGFSYSLVLTVRTAKYVKYRVGRAVRCKSVESPR
jgi:hypothetical protein